MKAIQKELGKEDPHTDELNKLEEKIKEAKMPKEVEDVAVKELGRLRDINPASPEYPVSRTYLDYLINIPWNKRRWTTWTSARRRKSSTKTTTALKR